MTRRATSRARARRARLLAGPAAALVGLAPPAASPAAAAPPPDSAAIAERLAEILARPLFRHARAGVAVLDLASGRTIFEHDADHLFVPGSTTKILPVGTALRLLGPDHRFRTPVYRTGGLDGGVLDGDLVLVASGDPNLSNRLRPDGTLAFVDTDHTYAGPPGAAAVAGDPLAVLRSLARQVAAAGIRRVVGAVRVDASLFPEDGALSPIVVNDNVIDVTVAPAAEAVYLHAR